jgi:hypothetical protein
VPQAGPQKPKCDDNISVTKSYKPLLDKYNLFCNLLHNVGTNGHSYNLRNNHKYFNDRCGHIRGIHGTAIYGHQNPLKKYKPEKKLNKTKLIYTLMATSQRACQPSKNFFFLRGLRTAYMNTASLKELILRGS